MARRARLRALTTQDKYNQHIQEQLKRFRTQMVGPPLAHTRHMHVGHNYMIYNGTVVPTPFKVIRWNGDYPGYPRMVDQPSKRWWDKTSPRSKASAAGSGIYPRNNPKLRNPSQITHVTLHNRGTTRVPCVGPGKDCRAAIKCMRAFNGRGFIAQLLVDKFGQIYQMCDPVYETHHVGGFGLEPEETSPNPFSIAIEMLSGVPRSVVGNGLGEQPVLPAPDGYYHMRRYNLDKPGDITWNRPMQQFIGYAAEHEAVWELLLWLERHSAIELKIAAMDARLSKSMMMNTRIQSHYQLQSGIKGRTDGQSFIFWCMAHNKGELIFPSW